MVSPVQKKQAIDYVVDQRQCSVRQACCYLVVYRSTYRYQAQELKPKQVQLHQRIIGLSWSIPGKAIGASALCWWEKADQSAVSKFSVSGVKKVLKWHQSPSGNLAREILRGCRQRQLIPTMFGPGILFLIERIRAARSKC